MQVSFWAGPPGEAGSQQIGPTQALSDIAGCGGYRVAEVAWPDRGHGANRWYARLENAPAAVASAGALVASSRLDLPIILKAH